MAARAAQKADPPASPAPPPPAAPVTPQPNTATVASTADPANEPPALVAIAASSVMGKAASVLLLVHSAPLREAAFGKRLTFGADDSALAAGRVQLEKSELHATVEALLDAAQ